jgi:hypothetical protein
MMVMKEEKGSEVPMVERKGERHKASVSFQRVRAELE